MTPLIPLYDLHYKDKVIAAAKRKHIAVIVNIDDGPGKKLDKDWLRVIKSLRQYDAEIFGYIDTVVWKGDKSSPSKLIQQDVSNWSLMYGVSRYFYDDWQKEQAIVNPSFSIANPGCDMKTSCSFTMVWETKGYLKSKPSKVNGQVVFSMQDNNYIASAELARMRGVKYFYAVTAKDDWHAYDDLPKYFDQLIDAI